MRTLQRARSLVTAGLLTAATAVTGVVTAAPAQAAPHFDCLTEIQNGGQTGTATCTNVGAGNARFRVHVVCGLAFDQYSSWVTVRPGAEATTSVDCPFTLPGQGVGRVTVEFMEGG